MTRLARLHTSRRRGPAPNCRSAVIVLRENAPRGGNPRGGDATAAEKRRLVRFSGWSSLERELLYQTGVFSKLALAAGLIASRKEPLCLEY